MYINEKGITLTDYLSVLVDQEEEIIGMLSHDCEDYGTYHEVNNPVATTWLISFEQIRHRLPLTADDLSLMACLYPRASCGLFFQQTRFVGKKIDAIGTLDAYSFITR